MITARSFRYFLPVLVCFLTVLSSCTQEDSGIRISGHRIQVDGYSVHAFSPHQLVSTWPAPEWTIPQPILYKLSLNGLDNEGGFGEDHELVIPAGVHEFFPPLLHFGQRLPNRIPEPALLDPPARVHFRVNLHDILEEFEKRGFTVTPTGDTILAEDFEGLYLAGSAPPLSWIWDSPGPRESSRFTDADGDSIYELTVDFHVPDLPEHSSWELGRELTSFPEFHAKQSPLLEAITNLAMEEVALNVRADSTLSAGAKWPGVWTRDVSYATQLALAYFQPELSRRSLLARLDGDDRIRQDTGTGGSWPVSSDRHIWTLAAWEIFLATGDSLWLERIRQPVLQALREDLVWNRDPYSGLLKGETSFEDWREQTYPIWASPADIQASFALSTNILFKRALEIGSVLTADPTEAELLAGAADQLEESVLSQFWNSATEHLSAYLLQTPSWLRSETRDALGEALAALYTHSDPSQWRLEFSTYRRTRWGTPVLDPQLPHSLPYHNQAIWPFVEAYSGLAAKRVGAEQIYAHSFRSMLVTAGLHLTHSENFHYLTARREPMEMNSDRQLWSGAGWLGMLLKGLFGMEVVYAQEMQQFGLQFHPSNPFTWDQFELLSLQFRGASVDLHLHGKGSVLDRILVNTVPRRVDEVLLLEGGKAYDIELSIIPESRSDSLGVNLQRRAYTLPDMPVVKWQGDTLTWSSDQDQAILIHNGFVQDTLRESFLALGDTAAGFYSLQALDSLGMRSLPTLPHYLGPAIQILLKDQPPYYYELGSGSTSLQLSFRLPSAGSYLMRFLYLNPSGPVSTGSDCGLAALQVNSGWRPQMVVFPQTGHASFWQTTAWSPVQLEEGINSITLDQEALPAENMNQSHGTFRLHALELIPDRDPG